MDAERRASVVELGQGEGRLSLAGHGDLRAGEPIEVLVEGRWVPGHVEWDSRNGWVLRLSQEARGQSDMTLLLRPGMVTR